MAPSADPSPSRPFAFALWLGLPLAAMGLLLAIDPAPLDFWIAGHFHVPGSGFVARDNYWLETILHDRAKTLVIVFVLALGVALAASTRLAALRPWRCPLAYALLAIALSTAVVPSSRWSARCNVRGISAPSAAARLFHPCSPRGHRPIIPDAAGRAVTLRPVSR